MKVHTDILTEQDFHKATSAGGMVGVAVKKLEAKGSRSRKRSFDVTLSGTHKGPSYAATWDEWGIFINALFVADPDAIVGMYPSYEAFRDVTYCRFDNATQLLTRCTKRNHKWEAAGGEINQCKWCGAQFNWGDLKR